MKRTLSCFLLVLLSQQAPQVAGASSTVIGSSSALQCYQQSQVVLSRSGISHCNEAITKGDLSRRDLAATYSNRGLIYAGNGDLEVALQDHNKAIEILPTLSQAYINRGNVYHHMQRYEDALAEYRRAIALQTGPRHVPHYNAGLTLLKLKRPAEAKDEFESALEFQPGSQQIQSKIDYIQSLDENEASS